MRSIILKWSLRLALLMALACVFGAAFFLRSGLLQAITSPNVCDTGQCEGITRAFYPDDTPSAITFTGSATVAFSLDHDKEMRVAFAPDRPMSAATLRLAVDNRWIAEKQLSPDGPAIAEDELLFCGRKGENRIELSAQSIAAEGAEPGAPPTVRLRVFKLESRQPWQLLPLADSAYMRRAEAFLRASIAEQFSLARIMAELANPFVGLCLVFLALLAVETTAGRTATARKPLNMAYAAALLLFAALAALMACKPFWLLLQTLSTPVDANVIEGRELLKASLFPDFKAMYTDADTYGYHITLYPPVFFAFAKAATLALGKTLLATRLVSLFFFCVLLSALGAIVYGATRNKALAVLAALLPLTNPDVAAWAVLGRPDTTAWAMLALAVAAYAASLREGLAPRPYPLLAAAVLAVLAVLTKQQTLPFVLGLITHGMLAPERRWPLLTLFVLPFGVLLGGVVLGLNLATGGTFLFDTLFYPVSLSKHPDFNSAAWLATRLTDFFTDNFVSAFFFCIFAVIAVLRGGPLLPSVMLLVYAPFYVSLMQSWGADTNYSLGVMLLLSTWAAAGSAWCCLAPRRQALLALAVACLMLGGTRAGLSLTWSELPRLAALPPEPDREAAQTFVKRTRMLAAHFTGPVLVDAESFFILADNGNDLFTFDSMEMLSFHKSGHWCWPCADIVKDVISRRFHLVLLRDSIDSPLTRVIKENYKPHESGGAHTLYIARP